MSKLIVVLSTLVVIGVVVTTAFRTPQETSKPNNSIESIARRAKAEGKSSVTIPGPIIDYPNMGLSLDDVLKKYSALVVEVAESTSFVQDSNNILTVYKFKILDFVSQKPADACDTCPPLVDQSRRLSAAKFNEFLLQVSGGTVTVDDVQVTMRNSGNLDFAAGKKYMMLVSFTPGGMARLAVGPSGVFEVNADDSLKSANESKHLVPTQMRSRFSNNLSAFKQAARRF